MNVLIRFLLQNPDLVTAEGAILTDVLVRDLTRRAALRAKSLSQFDGIPDLRRALKGDGFVVTVEGEVRRTLPEALDLPKTDNEIHALLQRFGFTIATVHLDHAITNHSEGRWEPANSQLRSFMEALTNGIAETLSTRLGDAALPLPIGTNPRRIWLANLDHAFFLLGKDYEWEGSGLGFLEAFFRRLNTAGSHAGLSDEDDCTFRLHLVLLVARLMLQRLQSRMVTA